jgi:hypothetical protein
MQQKVREDGGSSSLSKQDFSLGDAQSIDLQLCMIKQVHYLHEQEHKQDEILRFLV